jgi:hypothetical protein
MMMETLPAAEESELKALGFTVSRLQVKYWVFLFIRALRPRVWYIYLLFPALIIFTISFTLLAINQANQVIKGTAESTNQYGLLDYNVETVRIMPAQAEAKQTIAPLVGKKLYLLGQNAQYVILYAPQNRSTVRVPTAAVIIASSP